MLSAIALAPTQNQAVEVVADDDVDRVTIELVGDLASYRPHGKVVVLEGKSGDGFDVTMVRRLFPDFARRVNLISGGHKKRVRDLYSVLSEPAIQSGVRNRFFAIVDRDSDSPLPSGPATSEFSWDVYHIENYLLDVGSIRAATVSLEGSDRNLDDSDIIALLHECATELVDGLVLIQIRRDINSMFVDAIRIEGPPDTKSPARGIEPSVKASARRISEICESLTIEEIERRTESYRGELENSLKSDTWMKEFPGRLILRRYAGKRLGGRIDSKLFLNMVLDRAVERGIQPPSMKRLLDDIASR